MLVAPVWTCWPISTQSMYALVDGSDGVLFRIPHAGMDIAVILPTAGFASVMDTLTPARPVGAESGVSLVLLGVSGGDYR